jgi:hypothetical protein
MTYRTTRAAHFLELFATMRSPYSQLGDTHFELSSLLLRFASTTHHGDDNGPSSAAVNTSAIFLPRYLIPLYPSDFLTVVVVAVVAAVRLWLDHDNQAYR